ncbi:MAG: hypothetical protein J6J23_07330 [Clostridia bacterium]|nr:hypothetical protein [Clostridia bacterium]
MKNLFNVRFIFIYFVALILGVLTSRLISYFSNLDSLVLVILMTVSVNLLIFALHFGKKTPQLFLQITNCLLVFVMAMASTLSFSSWLNKDMQRVEDGNYLIIGKVIKVDYTDAVIYLKDTTAQDLDVKFNGEVKVYLYDEALVEDLNRGDKISLECNLKMQDINENFKGSNQTAVAFIRDIDGVSIEKSKNIKDKFKRKVWEL